MAGGPLIHRRKRATAVRFEACESKRILAPVNGEFGDHEGAHDGSEKGEGAEDEWEGLATKYEQLEQKVKEYLDDQQDMGAREPPVVNALVQMTKEQWEKHQVTHTPYSASCRRLFGVCLL